MRAQASPVVTMAALYLAIDDAQKNVFTLDFERGTVLRLFSVDTTGEHEGMAFLARDDGSFDAHPEGHRVTKRHRAATSPAHRAPLRSEVCH